MMHLGEYWAWRSLLGSAYCLAVSLGVPSVATADEEKLSTFAELRQAAELLPHEERIPIFSVCIENSYVQLDRKLPLLAIDSLESLVMVRREKKLLLDARLRQLLTNGRIRRLRQLEDRFGLTADPPLSRAMSLSELLPRLEKISAVLSNQ